jgi:hypothetical protein
MHELMGMPLLNHCSKNIAPPGFYCNPLAAFLALKPVAPVLMAGVFGFFSLWAGNGAKAGRPLGRYVF